MKRCDVCKLGIAEYFIEHKPLTIKPNEIWGEIGYCKHCWEQLSKEDKIE